MSTPTGKFRVLTSKVFTQDENGNGIVTRHEIGDVIEISNPHTVEMMGENIEHIGEGSNTKKRGRPKKEKHPSVRDKEPEPEQEPLTNEKAPTANTERYSVFRTVLERLEPEKDFDSDGMPKVDAVNAALDDGIDPFKASEIRRLWLANGADGETE